MLECTPAWEDNGTWSDFVCFAWQEPNWNLQQILAVNYAPHQSQCYLRIPFGELKGKDMRLQNLMGPESYERRGDDVLRTGLYLDLSGWAYNVFEVTI